MATNCTRAFTLIEMIAATALAAILVVTMLRVTVSLTRVQATVRQMHTAERWIDDLHGQIERDLDQSQKMLIRNGALILEGSIGNGQHNRRQHGPARVIYRLVTEDVGGLLVREERDLLDRSNRALTRQLLCADVQDFEVTLSRQMPTSIDNVLPQDSQSTMPSSLTYEITWGSAKPVTTQRSIGIR